MSSEWNEATFTWGVQTDKNTRYVLADGEKGEFSDIGSGDYLTITGYLKRDATQIVWIDADVIQGVALASQKEVVTQLSDTE